MTAEQQRKVRADRRAMLSVPIFDPRDRSPGAKVVRHGTVIGVLSIDTRTDFHATLWRGDREGEVLALMGRWADVLGLLLT